jgi:hypothetical protein
MSAAAQEVDRKDAYDSILKLLISKLLRDIPDREIKQELINSYEKHKNSIIQEAMNMKFSTHNRMAGNVEESMYNLLETKLVDDYKPQDGDKPHSGGAKKKASKKKASKKKASKKKASKKKASKKN